MTWLTWRQTRTQTTAFAAVVLALAGVLLETAGHLHDIAGTASTYNLMSGFEHQVFYAGVVVLAVAPALLGAFWGAPLVAREIENGTHQLAWSQSVTRGRWLAVRLGGVVLSVAVLVGVASWLVTWWAGPIDGAQSRQRGALPLRLTPVTFGMRGVVPVGYAVLAVCVGVVLGLLLKRTLPAMALTVAVMVFVQIALPHWVRPHLAPQVTSVVAISRDNLDGISANGPDTRAYLIVRPVHKGDWVLRNQTLDPSGRPVALPSWTRSCFAPPVSGDKRVEAPGDDVLGPCFARLSAEGYRQRVVYQPVGRFWRLQWTETALVLALAGLLALLSSRLLRRVS